MSESVYVWMCREIGTPQQVAARRDIVDIKELLSNQDEYLERSMMSGSMREGFRLRDSDLDTMYWPTNHRVIWDFSQSEYYNILRQALILCDSSESPAGFTLLWLPLECAGQRGLSSCEIINDGLDDEDKLLCSYHMKTAVFWAIQQDTLPHWCPQNLLAGFWVCFKLLLKWVYEGISPNFFIPENNMFLSKIHGQAQTSLFRRLYGLYEKGIALLLHSPSIRSSIIDVLCNPRLTVCTDEHTLIYEAEFDEELFGEIYTNDIQHPSDLQHCMKYLNTVEKLIGSPLTQYQVVNLQKYTTTILHCTAFILHNIYTNTGVNKQVYIADKMSCHMLKLAAKFGFVSDMLYIVMYYYKTLRYREALSVIEMTKVKLAQPYLMSWGYVDRERYTEAVGGQSWSTKMRQAVAMNIKLANVICYICELLLEQQSSRQNRGSLLFIPPFVLLHMLEFLSSRHVDTMRAQTGLDDLQFLVHHDQGQLVPVEHRDISWEILGICQQMAGNPHAALYSYQQSLGEDPFNKIQTATTQRIHE
uniref:Mab-21-like HhH/H2TH-like domain-containing protein n=1 Tax=Magallana gigas TaxID=29159 RepID=K1PTB4_MAGGI